MPKTHGACMKLKQEDSLKGLGTKTNGEIRHLLQLNFEGVDGPILHRSGTLSYRVWSAGCTGEDVSWVMMRFEADLLQGQANLFVQNALQGVRRAKCVLLSGNNGPGHKGTVVVSAKE